MTLLFLCCYGNLETLTIFVSVSGLYYVFPMASSQVTVPGWPPEIKISHTVTSDSQLRLSISFDDDVMTEDCYAFHFEKCYFYEGDLHPSGVDDMAPSFDNKEETAFLDLGPFDAIWTDGGKHYGISDREFNVLTKTIELNMEYPVTATDMWKYAYYRVHFSRISPERLRYETALMDKGTNILGFTGLAPVTFAYTNVVGGTGCVSCSHVYVSDWIAISPEE